MTDERKRIVEALLDCSPCAKCTEMQELGCIFEDTCVERNAPEIAANLIERMAEELERIKAERDAAVEDIPRYCWLCKHADVPSDKRPCVDCRSRKLHFEWRGLHKRDWRSSR